MIQDSESLYPLIFTKFRYFYRVLSNYAPQIQSMIYTANWIERLNRDFRRVTRMRTAMPNEESVLTLMGSVAMDHKAYDRKLPNITYDMLLFPE